MLDVHTGNIILSGTGTSGVSGTAGILKFQGTRDGITSFAAGAQASNTFNYVFPTAVPVAGQVLTINTISGASPYAVALNWSTPTTATYNIRRQCFSPFSIPQPPQKLRTSAQHPSVQRRTRTFTFPMLMEHSSLPEIFHRSQQRGTIASGLWNGTQIGPTFGRKQDKTTYTLGDILYSSASNTLSKLCRLI